MSLIDFLEPDAMFALCHSEEGKRRVRDAAKKGRIIMSVYELLGYLIEMGVFNRPLTQEEQENMANIIGWSLFDAKHDVLLEFLRKIPDQESVVEGNC